MNSESFSLSNKETLQGFIFLVISIISFALSFFLSNKNRNHLFLSLRSMKILNITNISIFLCLVILCIERMFKYLKEDDQLYKRLRRWLYSLFFISHLLMYISTFVKYHHLIISTTINYLDDDLTGFKTFKTNSYHFEYFYMRLMGIITLILLLAYVIMAAIPDASEYIPMPAACIELEDNAYSFVLWIVIFFLENFILFTYGYILFKKELKAKIKSETVLITILNFSYSLILGITIRLKLQTASFIITLVYLLLFQFICVYYPVILCKIDKVTTCYSLTKDTAEDLYLFLSDEKCYERFVAYLSNKEQEISIDNNNLIDAYTYILKFRMNGILGFPNRKIAEEIYKKFIDSTSIINVLKISEPDWNKLYKIPIENCINNKQIKIEIFDDLLEKIYSALYVRFGEYQKSEDFKDLIYEINYDTYIRCKLANCGLIKK